MQQIAHRKLAKVRIKRNCYSYCKSPSPDKKAKANILAVTAGTILHLGK